MRALGITGRLAVWSARHARAVCGAWLLLLACVLGAATMIRGSFTSTIEFTNHAESQRALDLVRGFRGGDPLYEVIVLHSSTLTGNDAAFKQTTQRLVNELRASGLVDPLHTYSYLDAPPEAGVISKDGQTALIPTLLDGTLDESPARLARLGVILAKYDGHDGFTAINGGFASINDAFAQTAQRDLATEGKVLPFALAVLVAVFGAVAAALLPMGIAVVAIGLAIGVVEILTHAWQLSFFVANIVTMMGLATGIDYALFIVARFREERRAGHHVEDAVGLAGDSAIRAVLFSGVTVVIALCGLLIVPTTIFISLGLGAAIVVIFAVCASLTLLPALLGLLGDRVNRFAIPLLARDDEASDERSFWARTAELVMRRPWPAAIGTTALLVGLALPYGGIRLGTSFAASIPERFAAKQAFEILDREFSAGRLTPTQIVIHAPDVTTTPITVAFTRLQMTLATDPEIRQVSLVDVSPRHDVAVLDVAVPGDLASDEAIEAVRRLRSQVLPPLFAGTGAQVYVGGPTALNADFFDLVDRYTPITFAFVLGFSFLLLLLIFRSIVVPLKSIVMNLLSVGAAYGVVTAVFQNGWGRPFLHFRQVPEVEAWIPLFMFTILFGLSMDYHIFLLSRVRERYDETSDNAESVAFGLRTTANIITGAAAIMVTVFAGFAFGDLVMLQQIGVGLAVAIFLDATIVRTILVPATMRLLGDANWYLPWWLHWLPDLRVERVPEARPLSSMTGEPL